MRNLPFLGLLATTALVTLLCGCERPSTSAPALPQTEVAAAQTESPVTKALLNQGLERASKAFRGQAVAIEAFTSLSLQGEVVCVKYIAIKPGAEKTSYFISSPSGVDLAQSEMSPRWSEKCSSKIKNIHLDQIDVELNSARNTLQTGPKTPKFNTP
ncbi:hypothetical protein [Caulobacter vibrioides]|uniref:hypothetical protein n=1 Tax=Caulobacter vibrioides TaxID=155892 RepID=UPI0015E681D4|nr:hypothetical protein [Caulobacter vibrioides]